MNKISPVGSSYNAYNKVNEVQTPKKEPVNKAEPRSDKIEKSNTKDSPYYISKAQAAEITSKQKAQMLSQMVSRLFKGQSESASKANFSYLNDNEVVKLKQLLNDGVPVDAATQSQAQAAISANGEFGVEAVSDRLVDFALSLAQSDPSKYEGLKNAIVEGFKAAEKVWGGQLPEICYKTYDRTMEKLESAFKELKPSEEKE